MIWALDKNKRFFHLEQVISYDVNYNTMIAMRGVLL